MNNQLLSNVYGFISARERVGELYVCDKPHIVVVHDYTPLRRHMQIYRPVLCLVLQGEKEVLLGDRRIVMRAGQSLIVSHDLPVTTQLLKASKEDPYIAIVMELDLAQMRSLYEEASAALPKTDNAQSMDVGHADEELVEAVSRLLALHARPAEVAVMEPLIRHEIHFRLLLAHHGGMLRELLRLDSHAGRISKAICHIQDHFREPLAVRQLAGVAGMSLSSFHEHFKAVTGSSPLQYHKAIRLIEARRLLQEGGHSVSGVAFDVGYESPTQFSREYSRKFEKTPREEMKALALA